MGTCVTHVQEGKEAESSSGFFRILSCQHRDVTYLNVGMIFAAAVEQQSQRLEMERPWQPESRRTCSRRCLPCGWTR